MLKYDPDQVTPTPTPTPTPNPNPTPKQVRLDVETFLRDPAYALRTLRAMPAHEVARRQRTLATYPYPYP